MGNYIAGISKSIGEKELALFCGAGISKNSGLPLANELKRYILGKLAIDEKDMAEILYSALPFEAFMEAISENVDISKLLDMFKEGKPNTNHILIARLARNGYLKTIFTTNFDLLIEKALEEEGLKRDEDFEVYYDEEQFSRIDFDNVDGRITRIFKVHGSVEDKDSIRTTLEVVASKTLSDMRMGLMRYLFSTARHKKVLILGYSCSDDFDITPQIKSVVENQKEIVLVDHCHSEIRVEDIKTKSFKNPFKRYPGSRIVYDTDKFIEQLWTSFKPTIGEYELRKSEAAWGEYVDHWARGVEENKGYRKYFIAASMFYMISSLGKAIEYSNRSLENAKKTDEKEGESKSYRRLGDAYYGLGDFDRAIGCYEKSLEIAKELEDKPGELECYSGLGDAYWRLGNFSRAIEYHEESLDIAKAIGDKAQESRCFKNLGLAHHGLGDFAQEIKYSRKSLEIAKEIGDKVVESRCYANLGLAYRSLGDFNKAIEYHEKSLNIARKLGDKAQESTCYGSLGVACRRLGDLNRAIEYHEKSLNIAKELGDKAVESACYINLGVAYHGLGDFNRAIEYYLNAENIFEEIGQIHYLKKLYNKLSLAYEKIGDNENIEKYRKLANSG